MRRRAAPVADAERRDAEDRGPPAGFAPDWPAPPGVHAWTTERGGGVSTGACAALNLGTHVEDRPEHVAENRRRLRESRALPSEPVWLNQVHGTRILEIEGPPGASRTVREAAEADGAVTAIAGVVCAVMTADCLPVLLCDREGRRVAAAHAGWRGLAAGVLPAAVAALGCAPREVLAWLGPAIGPGVYEVGAEVRAALGAAVPGAADYLVPNARGRFQADLYGLARASLAAAGVERVFGGGFCTFSEPRRFFSHRRAAPCGRMATLIWRA
jgi:YfiH family protein